jgi:hypothetical protein
MKPKKEIKLFLFALATFAIGCVAPLAAPNWIRDFTLFPAPLSKVVSHWQLRAEVSQVMDPSLTQQPNSIVMDPHYVVPSESTARRLIAAAAKKVDRNYVQHAWDCEDVSMQFICEIRRLAKVETRQFPSGFPAALIGAHVFGPIPEFSWPWGTEYPFGHAMVAIRIDDGRWLLVEPQNGRVIDITSPIYEGLIEVVLVIL